MKVSIYSIQQTLFEGEVTSVSFSTREGEITILDNHIPLISQIAAGAVRLKTKGDETQSIPIAGGIAEVRPRNEMVILAV